MAKRKTKPTDAVNGLLTPDDLLSSKGRPKPEPEEDPTTEGQDDEPNEGVQGVREPGAEGQQVLPEAREGAPAETGSGGVPPAPAVQDDQRVGEPDELPFPGAGRAETTDARLSRILQNLLQKKAPREFQTAGGETTAEVLAQTVMNKALEGNQWAIDFVSNRIEGRPGNVAPERQSEADVEAELERVTVTRLNDLAAGIEEETPSDS